MQVDVAGRSRVAILISGRGSNAMALIKAARRNDCPFEIVLVASDKPDAEGLALAAAEGVPVVGLPKPTPKDKSQFYAALDKVIRDHGGEYVALAGFMRILPPEFVAKWQGRMLNVHPSLLPKYKGLDTHQRALAAGDRVAGCSVHLVTAELDDGPVLGKSEVPVIAGDTPETLAARVLVAEHELYARVLGDYVRRHRG
jgi:phosphoribosylglycinamide formyltransferase 1